MKTVLPADVIDCVLLCRKDFWRETILLQTELGHDLAHLEKFMLNFLKFVGLQCVSIFSIFNDPCYFVAYYYLSGIFFILVN